MKTFRRNNVRFIAVNNGIDSEKSDTLEFAPFINIMSEWYAKDISKKVKTGIKTKGMGGKPIAPYGYIKDPEDKLHWITDKEAAEVVRKIFHLCVQGYGVSKIANMMTERRIMNPTAHAKALSIGAPDNRSTADDYKWGNSTISHMLIRQEYIGNTVNFKTYRKSYKQKKQLKNDPENWHIFEGTHKAIIDKETFDIVQHIQEGRRRVTPMGEMPILSGMLFCADCGAKLYQVWHRDWTHDKEHFVCATYRKVKGGCSSHQIRNIVVEKLLLDGIRNITAFAREHEDEFVQMVTDKTRAEVNKNLRDARKELEQAESRIKKLDGIIKKLYKDNIDSKVSDERFSKMTASYEDEQRTLESKIDKLKSTITTESERTANVDVFLKLVRKYTDLKELNAGIIRKSVEKIYVYKAEKSPTGRRTQKIKIIWNCIGEFKPPKHRNTEENNKKSA